jgi:hypothetical protein
VTAGRPYFIEDGGGAIGPAQAFTKNFNVRPVSGVNFLGFAQKWPKIEDSSQSYCSSRLILEDATSVPQWF